MKRTLITGLAAAAVMAGGLGLAGGTAQAEPGWGPSYSGGNCPSGMTCTHWCPGDPPIPGSEFGILSWDWNVCHDWYWNSDGIVDVATMMVYPWHGTPHVTAPPPSLPDVPPPPPPQRPDYCPPFNVPFFAPSACGGL
jgi:hypothetical protein